MKRTSHLLKILFVLGLAVPCAADWDTPTQDSMVMTATTVDEQEPQLLDQEIACDCVTSLDDIIALIRTHVRVVPDRIPAILS